MRGREGRFHYVLYWRSLCELSHARGLKSARQPDTITKPAAFTRKAANNNPTDGSRKKKAAIEERVEKETS